MFKKIEIQTLALWRNVRAASTPPLKHEFEARGVLKGTAPLPTFAGCRSLLPHVSPLAPKDLQQPQSCGWGQASSFQPCSSVWSLGRRWGSSTLHLSPVFSCSTLLSRPGSPHCLLSLDTLCASQFTLVFQLSLRASLNFSLKCFSASSSVFPRARESCKQEAQISAQVSKPLLKQGDVYS